MPDWNSPKKLSSCKHSSLFWLILSQLPHQIKFVLYYYRQNDKLQKCVNDHSKYSTEVNSFKEFAASQSELLSQCADVTGEKAELEHKAQILGELKQVSVPSNFFFRR
jgi:hypothetical protein